MSAKLILLLCLLFVFGCSTSEKSTEQTNISRPKLVKDIREEDDTVSNIPPKKVSKNEKQNLYSNLVNAYEGRNSRKLREVASELLAQDSKDRKALMALGAHYFRSGAYGMAKLLWNRALESYPNDSALLNNLGLVALKENDERAAISFFKKSIRNNSDSVAANINLGLIYLKYKNYNSSNVALEKAYESNAKSPAFLNNYALSLRGLNKTNDSTLVYEKALAKKGNQLEVLLNYGAQLVLTKKDVDKGLKLLEQARLLTSDKGILRYINDIKAMAK